MCTPIINYALKNSRCTLLVSILISLRYKEHCKKLLRNESSSYEKCGQKHDIARESLIRYCTLQCQQKELESKAGKR